MCTHPFFMEASKDHIMILHSSTIFSDTLWRLSFLYGTILTALSIVPI